MKTKITHEFIEGDWREVSPPRDPERPNFVICCSYGDWSGFRTLAECLAQRPDGAERRPLGFFWIEQR